MPTKRLMKWMKGNVGSGPKAQLPEGERVYAIGDIHGRVDLLIEAHRKIASDTQGLERWTEVYLGDYIDRGTWSKDVIDILLQEPPAGATRIFLKGNHEETLIQFLVNPEVLAAWRSYGGLETLHSYGVDVSDARTGTDFQPIHNAFLSQFPLHHRTFFQNLQISTVIGDYFFVHAGIRPGVQLELQREEDLIWIRDEFLQSRTNHGKVIVHGHTPVEQPEMWPNRINIDTGAYLSGNLTCLVLESDDKRIL